MHSTSQYELDADTYSPYPKAQEQEGQHRQKKIELKPSTATSSFFQLNQTKYLMTQLNFTKTHCSD